MLLTLVIILILIWSAVVGSLYSNFLVFYQNFSETENYHKARYASVAAIERAELVIKQREPWFEWNWWWILDENWSTWSFIWADQIISGFSYLSNTSETKNKSTLFWKINSRTNRIPSAWSWNVEKLLATGDSLDYNMMDYENAEIFMLYYDNANGNPYRSDNVSINKSDLTGITVTIRLPPYIRSSLWDLNTYESLIPRWYTDDALVDWQIKGKFQNHNFTMFATQNAAWSHAADNDSTIRESDLNNPNWISLTFGKDQRNPKLNKHNDDITIVSQDDSTITWFHQKFRDVFQTNRFSDLQLRLSLLNLVLWDGSLGKRYPFLEYYADFWSGKIVSDKYYTIQTEWNYWDYQIDTVIYKPTITESILKSFTTIL